MDQVLENIKVHFDNSQTSVTLFDCEYTILYANKKANLNSNFVFGHSITEGESILYYARPDEIDGFKSKCKSVLNSGEPHHHINQFLTFDGQSKWFSYEFLPLTSEQENRGIMLLVSDVTLTIESQNTMNTYIKLFENLSEGVCLFNSEGSHLWCNQK